jgi:hypothetical protein
LTADGLQNFLWLLAIWNFPVAQPAKTPATRAKRQYNVLALNPKGNIHTFKRPKTPNGSHFAAVPALTVTPP